MPKISRFKKRESARSGFDGLEISMIEEKPGTGLKVSAPDFDIPPPSRRSLGGEGDIAQGEMRANADTLASTETSGSQAIRVQVLAAGNQIQPNASGVPPTQGRFVTTVQVSGSNGAVDLTSDPQIARGQQNNVLSVQCVDSGVTLDDGTGLDLTQGVFNMVSGSIITFIYLTGGSVWRETSRSPVPIF